MIQNGHRYQDILEYTYPQFKAFLKAISKGWANELSDLTWSNFVGSNADSKKLQEIIQTLRE